MGGTRKSERESGSEKVKGVTQRKRERARERVRKKEKKVHFYNPFKARDILFEVFSVLL